MMEKLRNWARSLKQHLYALYLASKRNDVPWYAKAWMMLVLAYGLSPIDLIPDFIPIIGFLDDVLLLPIGIWLAIKLIPKTLWHDCLTQAKNHPARLAKNKWMGLFIVLLWLSALVLLVRCIWR
jgi:uncharacterized membrane protein YkvA (DUF1232 family)